MSAAAERLLDVLESLVVLVMGGLMILSIAYLCIEDILEEQAVAAAQPVLVAFDVSDRTDGLVVARDGTTGLLYAISPK